MPVRRVKVKGGFPSHSRAGTASGWRDPDRAGTATWNREHFTTTFINSPLDLLLIG